MRNYEFVSTDSHLEVSPDRWRPFVEREFPDYMEEQFADVPDEETRALVRDSAVEFFRLDRAVSA
jgi:hypothetical protein